MASSITGFSKEIVIHVFSQLEFPALCCLPRVCKQWSCLCHVLWEPLYNELSLCKKEWWVLRPSERNALVMRCASSYHIAKPVMDGNEKFHLALGGPLTFLEAFQERSYCDQVVYFWKRIKTDSTMLLKLLISNVGAVAHDAIYSPAPIFMDEAGAPIAEAEQTMSVGKLLSRKETQLVLSWTQNPLSPYCHQELLNHLVYATHGLHKTTFARIARQIRRNISYHYAASQRMTKQQQRRASV
jgi:hypothetical protein